MAANRGRGRLDAGWGLFWSISAGTAGAGPAAERPPQGPQGRPIVQRSRVDPLLLRRPEASALRELRRVEEALEKRVRAVEEREEVLV